MALKKKFMTPRLHRNLTSLCFNFRDSSAFYSRAFDIIDSDIFLRKKRGPDHELHSTLPSAPSSLVKPVYWEKLSHNS